MAFRIVKRPRGVVDAVSPPPAVEQQLEQPQQDFVGPTIGSQIGQPSQFDPSQESVLGAIARNLFKPVREAGSFALGAPGSALQAFGKIVNPIHKALDPFLSVEGLTSGGIDIPESLTISGMRENIAKPIGESLFGVGSQDPQEGLLEEITDRGSQFAGPLLLGALSGGASNIPAALRGIGGALGIGLAQGAAGVGLEKAGVGPIGQLIGELATGAAVPSTRRLLGGATRRATGRISKRLTSKETAAWNTLDQAAAKAPSIKGFEKELSAIEQKLAKNVAPTNRKAITKLINETGQSITGDEISATTLVGTRKKINDLLATKFKEGGGRGVLGEFKEVLDSKLAEKVGNLNLDAAKATSIKKTFERSVPYKRFIDKATKEVGKTTANTLGDTIEKLVPYGATAATLFLKDPSFLLSIPIAKALNIGAKNASLIIKNPQLRKEALKALKGIGKRSALSTAAVASQREPSKGRVSGQGFRIVKRPS